MRELHQHWSIIFPGDGLDDPRLFRGIVLTFSVFLLVPLVRLLCAIYVARDTDVILTYRFYIHLLHVFISSQHQPFAQLQLSRIRPVFQKTFHYTININKTRGVPIIILVDRWELSGARAVMRRLYFMLRNLGFLGIYLQEYSRAELRGDVRVRDEWSPARGE